MDKPPDNLSKLSIGEARFPAQTDTVREIFSEYAALLQVDLGFQDFEGELASLPGKYAAPTGCVLLASMDGVVIGCAALRALGAGSAEMKRLYVRPAGRALHVGRQLAEHICAHARAQGYQRIRLDTMPGMTAAQHL